MKGEDVKSRFAWLGAVALAAIIASQLEDRAQQETNGVIFITTRSAQDAYWRQFSSSRLWDGDDLKGPGVFSPGDAAMGALLQDYGYSVRLLPEKALSYTNTASNPPVEPLYDWMGAQNDPFVYYNGGGGATQMTQNDACKPVLVIVSGSGSSGDIPPVNDLGIPIMMGEHSCLGNNAQRDHSQIYLYSNKSSGNLSDTNVQGFYMQVVDPNHPIMKGIPLDSQGRVRIFRDPYPEENAHIPTVEGFRGNSNYGISWTAVDCAEGKSVPAPGLTILGTLATTITGTAEEPVTNINTNQVVFAVMEKGALLADTSTDEFSAWYNLSAAPSRLVHFYVNEGGSNNSRRYFNALTAWGRIIFVRACKWAMGEELEPYQGLGIIDVSLVGPSQIKLAWTGLIDKNFRIDGTLDFQTWQPVADNIVGGTTDTISRTLDISGAPGPVYMRVAAMP